MEADSGNPSGEKPELLPFLALVATPIGNLDDITLRALRYLRNSQFVAAEDTRRASILLSRHGIKAGLIPFHAFNEHDKSSRIIDLVQSGKSVSVLSDAGTPSISDPGYLIMNKALESGLSPIIIPGVSALSFSVTASALPCDRFSFHGFLPVKEGRRTKALLEIASLDMTAFLFESPYRMKKLLDEICRHISPSAPVAVIREASKLHEEILRGTAAELVAATANRNWKGECTVAICARKDYCKDNFQNGECNEED